MTDFRLYDFDQEAVCIYEDERYSVRDNGAVLRHSRTGKRPRPTDNHWTFGNPNDKNGYMHIASVRIHRIVATAFHGEPPTKTYVVDHIDTNRQNNRPENLRWLTRLENALLNPITLKRIEFICGSVEAFLEDPSKLGKFDLERNFEWMRSVSPEEAKASKQRLLEWAKSDKMPSGGSLGEWLYRPIPKRDHLLVKPRKVPNLDIVNMPNEFLYNPILSEEDHISDFTDREKATDLVISETPGAVQRKWNTPTEFPCCPQSTEEEPLKAYAQKLVKDIIFARNCYSTAVVVESATIDDEQAILVMCQTAETDAMKPWSLAKITYENGLYIHESCGTFFTIDGAEKQFCLARGLEWTGGDSMDDYC